MIFRLVSFHNSLKNYRVINAKKKQLRAYELSTYLLYFIEMYYDLLRNINDFATLVIETTSTIHENSYVKYVKIDTQNLYTARFRLNYIVLYRIQTIPYCRNPINIKSIM